MYERLVDEVMDLVRIKGFRINLAIHRVAEDNSVDRTELARAVNLRGQEKRKAKKPSGPIPPGPDFKMDPVAQYYWDH